MKTATDLREKLIARAAAGGNVSDAELRAAGIVPIAGGAKLFQGRDGAVRLYDGTGTPYFIELVYENADIDHPLGTPEPEQIPQMHRGRIDPNAHYTEGPDRALEGLPFSMSFRLANVDPTYQKLRDVLGLDIPATWTVGAITLTTTKGTTTRLSGGPTRTAETTPGFATSRMRTLNVCYLLTDPDGGSSHIGYRLNEVYFKPDEQRLREGDEVITIALAGQIYGSIAEIVAFPAGTEL